MPSTDRSAENPSGAGAGPAPAIAGALRGLYNAYQKSAFYPADHPAVPQAIARAHSRFQQVLDRSGPLIVGVARDHVLVEGQALSDSRGTLRAIAELLHELDLAVIQFEPGLSIDELAAFARLLGRARKEGLHGTALVRELEESPGTALRAAAIDYRALSFVEGRHTPQPGRREDAWESLARTLTDPESYVSEGGVRIVAEEVARAIAEREGAGLGALRSQLHGALRKMWAMPAADRERARSGLAAFVGALGPTLRRDLLRADSESSAVQLGLVQEIGGDLPAEEVLEVLQEIDTAELRSVDGLLPILGKLSQSARVPTAQERRDAGRPESGKVGNRETVGELLRRRVDLDCNPESYQSLLDDLSRSSLQGESRALRARYGDPGDPTAVKVHAAEIASRLLLHPEGGDFRAGLLRYVSSRCEMLLTRGCFDAVRDAALSARGYSRLASIDESTREAAEGFLEALEAPRQIERIIERLRHAGRAQPAAIDLLRLGGLDALRASLDLLSAEPSAPVRREVLGLLAGISEEQLDRLLADRTGGGWHGLQPIFEVLRALDPAVSVSRLERLSEHADPHVRRASLEALCDLDRGPRSPERHLTRALGDPSPAVSQAALRRLGEQDGNWATRLLGDCVDSTRVGPPGESRRRAADLLAARGPQGIERLGDCLRRLLVPRRRGDVKTAGRVARLLEPHADAEGIAALLRRWRWSLSGLLCRGAALVQAFQRRETE